MPNAISVIAVSARGSMYDPSAVFYMSKLVTGPEAADVVDINVSPAGNIAAVARAKHCSSHDVTVVILDRPRHQGLIEEVRAAGARIKLITDGMSPARSWRRARAPALTCCSERGHTGRHHRRLRDQVPGRGHPGQACAPR